MITTHVLVDEPRKRPAMFITQRRKDVLFWMAMGKTNAEIGDILGISCFTVKNHVEEILAIYGVPNRISAVLRAIARSDVSLDEVMKEFA